MDTITKLSKFAHWALRLALGSVFLYHGITKFPALEAMAAGMNIPVALVVVLAITETAGCALVLLGGFFADWMTRLGALILIPVMLGAIAMVHWGRWAFTPSDAYPMGGMEFQFSLIMIMVYLVLKGNTINQPGQLEAA